VTRRLGVVLVDYSKQRHSASAKRDLPEKSNGKFVQIRNQRQEYLVISPGEVAVYHANIVERFCKERGLDGSYDNARRRFTIHDPAWLITGGGRCDIDTTKKRIRFYGESMAYGRFDSRGFKEKVLSLAEFANYRMTIE